MKVACPRPLSQKGCRYAGTFKYEWGGITPVTKAIYHEISQL